MSSNEVYSLEHESLINDLGREIKQEKELISLMVSQISNTLMDKVAYSKSKLEGLRARSKFLSKYIQKRHSMPPSPTDLKSILSLSAEQNESIDLDLNSIVLNAHGFEDYEEIDQKMQRFSIQLKEKDDQIEKLKENITNDLQNREEIIESLEEEINLLKHQNEIYKHKIKSLRSQLRDYGSKIGRLEDENEKYTNQHNLMQDQIRDRDGEINMLLKKINDNEEEIRKYEKIFDSGGVNSEFASITNEKSSVIGKLKTKISSLELELHKCKEEKLKILASNDEKYEVVFNLYQRCLEEKHKHSDEILKLNEEVNGLKEKLRESERKEFNTKISLQEKFMARITKLRQEKYELRRKIQELGSRDFQNSENPFAMSLNEEAQWSDSGRNHHMLSIIDREEYNTRKSVITMKDQEQQVNLTKGVIENYRKEINKRDEEIKELTATVRKSLGPTKSSPSFFSKIRPNPIVLELYK